MQIPSGDIDHSGQKVNRFQGLSCLSDSDQQTTIKNADTIKKIGNRVCLVIDERTEKTVGNTEADKRLHPTDNKQDNKIDTTKGTKSNQPATGTESAIHPMANKTHSTIGKTLEHSTKSEKNTDYPRILNPGTNVLVPGSEINETIQKKDQELKADTEVQDAHHDVTDAESDSDEKERKEENHIQLASNNCAQIPENHCVEKPRNACFNEQPSDQTDENIEQPMTLANLNVNETRSSDTQNATEMHKENGYLLAASTSEQSSHKGNGELESTLAEGFNQTGQDYFSKTNTDRRTDSEFMAIDTQSAGGTVDRSNPYCNFRNFKNNDIQCAENNVTLMIMKSPVEFSNAMKNDFEKKNEIESIDTGALIQKVTSKQGAVDRGQCDLISSQSKTSSIREVTHAKLHQASATRTVSRPPDSYVGSHDLQCHICSRTFSNTDLRDYHVKHHDMMRYECPQSGCGNMFHDRRGLKNHIRMSKDHKDLIQSDILTKSGIDTKPFPPRSPKRQFYFKSKRMVSRRGHNNSKIIFKCPVENCGNIFQIWSDYHSHFLRMHYSHLHNSTAGGHQPTRRQIEDLKHISGTGGHYPKQREIENFIQYSGTTGNHPTRRQIKNFIQYSGTRRHHPFSSQQNIQNHSVFPTNPTLQAAAGSFETTTQQTTMTQSFRSDSPNTFKEPNGALIKSSNSLIFSTQVGSHEQPSQDSSLRCPSLGTASAKPVSLPSTEAENKGIAFIHTILEQEQLASRSRVSTSKRKGRTPLQFLNHRIAEDYINARDLTGRSSVDCPVLGGLNQTTLTPNISNSYNKLLNECHKEGATRHDAAQQQDTRRSPARRLHERSEY